VLAANAKREKGALPAGVFHLPSDITCRSPEPDLTGVGFDSRRERPIPQARESQPLPEKKKLPKAVNEKAASSAPDAAAA
jgi:hypothetical protein